ASDHSSLLAERVPCTAMSQAPYLLCRNRSTQSLLLSRSADREIRGEIRLSLSGSEPSPPLPISGARPRLAVPLRCSVPQPQIEFSARRASFRSPPSSSHNTPLLACVVGDASLLDRRRPASFSSS